MNSRKETTNRGRATPGQVLQHERKSNRIELAWNSYANFQAQAAKDSHLGGFFVRKNAPARLQPPGA